MKKEKVKKLIIKKRTNLSFARCVKTLGSTVTDIEPNHDVDIEKL